MNKGNQHITATRYWLIALLSLLLLSGCVTLPDPETSQNYEHEVVLVLEPGHSAGQTFVPTRPGLSQISIWVRTQQDTNLQLALYEHPDAEQALFQTQWTARDGQNILELQPLDHPSYYLELKSVSQSLQLLGRDEDAYAAGRAYSDGQPLAADLAFHTGYDYDLAAVITDIHSAIARWWLLLPLGLVLLLPGWLLLDYAGLKKHFDFGARLALAPAISLSLTALLLAWSTWMGLRWTATAVWAAALLVILLLFWRVFHHGLEIRFTTSERKEINWHRLGLNLLLVLIFLAAWLVRVAMVRDLAAPAWVDPVHHGLITRLIMADGQLPQDLSAYQLSGIERYHPGFHSSLAAFLTLSRLDLPEGMLLFGQALNALIVFPTYLFTYTLTHKRLAGLAAAGLVAFFLPLPAYYASWGRYTQLAGLLILPASLALWQRGMQTVNLPRRQRNWLLSFMALTLAGLFLHHYRVTAFLIILLPIFLLLETNLRHLRRSLAFLLTAAAASLLLAWPWLWPTLQELLIPKAVSWQGYGQEWIEFSTRLLTPAAGRQVMYLAAAGLGLAALRRQRLALTLPLWVLALWLLANLGAFGLPNPGFVNGLSVEIMLFLPLAVLGGYAIEQVMLALHAVLPGRSHTALQTGLLMLAVIACIWGAQQLLPILNPVTFLFRSADRTAIQWLSEHLPTEEPVLINPAGWGYGIYMGADGGYWISALSSHPTYPPPVLYGSGERQTSAEINQLIEQVMAAGEDAEALWQVMQSHDIEYVYLGARGGQLSAQNLQASDRFALLFNYQSTWLFQALP